MKMRFVFPILILLLLAMTTSVFAQDFTGVRLFTSMTGAEEAQGDPDGSGYAEVYLNYGQSQVCWNVSYENIGAASSSHIHFAPPGSPGGVVVGLSPIASGCKTVSQAVILAIIQNPEGYYVNVHTAAHPAGAIRGQLSNYGLRD